MSVKKTLTSIVLAGTLALSGCNGAVTDGRYDFRGKLENEYVEFSRFSDWWLNSNYLIVKKEDGRTIKYIDRGNDLKLDEVRTEEGIIYRNDVIGKQVLELAQQQYNDYLTKIFEYKQQKAVDSIK